MMLRRICNFRYVGQRGKMVKIRQSGRDVGLQENWGICSDLGGMGHFRLNPGGWTVPKFCNIGCGD